MFKAHGQLPNPRALKFQIYRSTVVPDPNKTGVSSESENSKQTNADHTKTGLIGASTPKPRSYPKEKRNRDASENRIAHPREEKDRIVPAPGVHSCVPLPRAHAPPAPGTNRGWVRVSGRRTRRARAKLSASDLHLMLSSPWNRGRGRLVERIRTDEKRLAGKSGTGR